MGSRSPEHEGRRNYGKVTHLQFHNPDTYADFIKATRPTQVGPVVWAASLGVRTRLETEMAVWETGAAMTGVTAMMGT